MAYYLTVSKKRGEYTPIDITKSKYFARTSIFKGTGMALQEVDLFTMSFNNEKELRRALFKEGLLERRYSGSPLSIRFLRDKKYSKVMYDFLYQKDIEYVMDPQKVITKINRLLINKDYRFILQYSNTFLEYHDCSATAPEVREFASVSIRNNITDKRLYELDENGDNILTRMTKLLIYKHYQSLNGRIEYTSEINYRNLHTVIAFIDHYEKKYIMDNSDENQLNLFSEIKDESTQKVRKRTKKSIIDGQISLFD